MARAAEEGGFDRDDMHLSRTAGKLDSAAWAQVSHVLQDALKQIEQIVEDSKGRAAGDPHSEAEESTIIMLHFAGPSSRVGPDRSASPVESTSHDVELPAIKGDL